MLHSEHRFIGRTHSGRSRTQSEMTTSTAVSGICEYELPLDPAWEFPRDDLMIGPGSPVRQSALYTYLHIGDVDFI